MCDGDGLDSFVCLFIYLFLLIDIMYKYKVIVFSFFVLFLSLFRSSFFLTPFYHNGDPLGYTHKGTQ